MIYVYAIVDASSAPLPPIRGLDGAELRARRHGDIAAVFTSHASLELRGSEEELWRHHEVAEALMADRAVLPLRFGTVLEGDDQLGATLAERHDEFAGVLDLVRGRVELAVRVLDAKPSLPPLISAPSGREFMLEKLERRRRAESIARGLHSPLTRHALASRRLSRQSDGALLTASYLVERDRVADFHVEVERLRAGWPELGIVCTGPWPAYSFSSSNGPPE